MSTTRFAFRFSLFAFRVSRAGERDSRAARGRGRTASLVSDSRRRARRIELDLGFACRVKIFSAVGASRSRTYAASGSSPGGSRSARGPGQTVCGAPACRPRRARPRTARTCYPSEPPWARNATFPRRGLKGCAGPRCRRRDRAALATWGDESLARTRWASNARARPRATRSCARRRRRSSGVSRTGRTVGGRADVGALTARGTSCGFSSSRHDNGKKTDARYIKSSHENPQSVFS